MFGWVSLGTLAPKVSLKQEPGGCLRTILRLGDPVSPELSVTFPAPRPPLKLCLRPHHLLHEMETVLSAALGTLWLEPAREAELVPTALPRTGWLLQAREDPRKLAHLHPISMKEDLWGPVSPVRVPFL